MRSSAMSGWNRLGDPVYWAPHMADSMLPGVPFKRILFQLAREDQTMPNMATTRLIKAANHPLTWEYRHDLALADGLQLPAGSAPVSGDVYRNLRYLREFSQPPRNSNWPGGPAAGGRLLFERWPQRSGSKYISTPGYSAGVI